MKIKTTNCKLFSAVVIVLLLSACHSKTQFDSFRNKPIPVETIVAGSNISNSSNHYIGEILAQGEIPLNFVMGGEITSIKVKNGTRVVQGQVIATVDDSQQRNLLESSNAILRQAEDGYARLEKVHAKGGISDVKWVEMQTDLAKAQSMAQSALKNYNDCTLRAQANGFVNLEDIQVGTRLVPGQRIGSLLTMNGMRAEFTVPETDVSAINIGDEIEVEVPAIKLSIKAHISEKELISTHLTHNYIVRASINSPEAKKLLQGMVCKINVSADSSEGIIIPTRSVQVRTNGMNVWLVKNGRAERRMVSLGKYVADGVMIESGIATGDTVIISGTQKMFNGAPLSF